MNSTVAHLISGLTEARTLDMLAEALEAASNGLGCAYFALSEHIDFRVARRGIRLHNYPLGWEQWFDDQRLGISDPVHRASQRRAALFRWHEVRDIIKLTPTDECVLATSRRHGIGDGVTIPANVPGEAAGSCSFAMAAGEAMSSDILASAQFIGVMAFEAARRLRFWPPSPSAHLTDRQRECVLWAARGKTDGEIATIMRVRPSTVIEHLRHARERYEVSSRTLLSIRALLDGMFCFSDVVR